MSRDSNNARTLFSNLQETLLRLVETLAGAMIVAMVLVVFIGVMDRFLLKLGLPWPEELARYLLIWVSMLSAAMALPKGYHYVVDYFYKSVLTARVQHILTNFICPVISLGTLSILLLSSIELTARVSWQRAPALNVSMSWAYAAMPMSFALMALFLVLQLLQNLCGRSAGSDQGEHIPAVPMDGGEEC